jgi:catechol 2,3-dioxygenase-like lactoylglutathione lyase family enzyme
MQPTGILETAIYAADLDAAEHFYGTILGLKRVTRVGNRHVFFTCGDQMLLVFNPEETRQPYREGSLPIPPHGAVGQCHFAFRATAGELDSWKRHLEGHGIEIESVVDWPQGGRSLYVRDPAGNSVEFAEPRIWGF